MSELDGMQGVVIDTMVLTYLFEAHPHYADLCEHIIGRIGEGFFAGVVTPITAAEILVKPLKQKHPSIADRYRRAIRNLPNVTMTDITLLNRGTGCRDTAEDSSRLRDLLPLMSDGRHPSVI